MTAVLQRIRQATVYADGLLSGEVGHGLYILLGVENGDDIDDAAVLAEKIAKLRIFEDAMGKMNLSVQDVDGEIMVVEDDAGKLVWECPVCGNRDQSRMSVARRTCGYIGTQFWNQGRTQEIRERVLHL